MDYGQIIDKVYTACLPFANEGRQADYIPVLAEVDANQFGLCLLTLDGNVYEQGNTRTRFSLQSISKVFALAMCLSQEADRLWQRMGKEPSGNAFNSLVQLE